MTQTLGTNADWEMSPPEAQGMQGEMLAQIAAFAAECDPTPSGVIVARHGRIVHEAYFGGFHAQSLHTVNSITKSTVSALVGIALQRGLLRSLEQPVADFFPEATAAGVDPRVAQITVRHLLTMTSSWAPMPFDLTGFATRTDLVEATLQRPLAGDPGSQFWYDNLGAHLLAVLLSRVTGTTVTAFAREALLGPLGIWTDATPQHFWRDPTSGPNNPHRFALWDEATGLPWKVDPSGHSTGYAGLHLTLRDLLALGQLYLDGGRWQGQQLIPADHVAATGHPQSAGGAPGSAAYGYLWWVRAGDPLGTYFAFGAGEQFIWVVPKLNLVAALASAPVNPPRPTDSPPTARAAALFDRFIIPAAKAR